MSPYYGLTVAETVLGKALKGIPRDSYVLATKVGRYGDDEFDFSAERVVASPSTRAWPGSGVDHIDLIQCHDIEFGDLDQVIKETVPGAARRSPTTGKVRYVGVTGYPLGGLDKVTAAGAGRHRADLLPLQPAGHQPGPVAAGLRRRRASGVINASVLAMGALTNRGAPPWHPAPPRCSRPAPRRPRLCAERGSDIAKLALAVRPGPDRGRHHAGRVG